MLFFLFYVYFLIFFFFFFFQAEDGIRDRDVTGVQTCALPICPGLDGEEDREKDQGADEGGNRRRVAPALLRGADEPVDQRDHAGRRGERPTDVELARLSLRLGDVEGRDQGEQDADGHVDEQHPPPRQPRGQHAAGQQADGGARH